MLYKRNKKQPVPDRVLPQSIILSFLYRPAYHPKIAIPTVEEVIGRALDSIGTYNDLDNRYEMFFHNFFKIMIFFWKWGQKKDKFVRKSIFWAQSCTSSHHLWEEKLRKCSRGIR